MIITAKFRGTDSLGYKSGLVYTLKFKDTLGISIKRLDGSGTCQYGSLLAFFKNWTDIEESLTLEKNLDLMIEDELTKRGYSQQLDDMGENLWDEARLHWARKCFIEGAKWGAKIK